MEDIPMADKQKEMEVSQQEIVQEETERTRECRCYVPHADIYEYNENIVVLLDMPGINENAVEITLEKNILNVKGLAQIDNYENYALAFSEYEAGDFERSFRISDAIDRDKIEARYNDGVLRLVLPRAEQAKTKKITVNVG
jgi:HSP20 family molecular chaperone IbpA